MNPNYAQGVNVADQEHDPDSMLNFYRRLLRVRKQTPALLAGDYTVVHDHAEDYLAFTRSTGSQTCLVALNFSVQPHTAHFDLAQRRVNTLFSTAKDEGTVCELSEVPLAAFEVFIGELVGA